MPCVQMNVLINHLVEAVVFVSDPPDCVCDRSTDCHTGQYFRLIQMSLSGEKGVGLGNGYSALQKFDFKYIIICISQRRN